MAYSFDITNSEYSINQNVLLEILKVCNIGLSNDRD